ncbi:uncharacterized protein LOC122062383 isoform X1 [Macadamia integrifolia]|uniref:uncharacterized protein LOC122062383 isoform X1 n=1 Tax=Macadamia integrifolia TaxID=60698 RepID=UPI001C4FC808|nr:uncharacterized protein LOC122062383 isoform X1 [Macadamia integrifolia]XP_042481928.1 uncharacterized protein LOC122062383 isoform X1 [Macadamia integrifolia]XP_042481930.1 uncharacterized protein LOC122062383 isoform X1 [Macadamia integrifolia]XP_042481931.1 uncharacterized protein LOC122062383 isoform X1 [Macadamia integrifolia]XP_042481932.1 uncharacterized protein LOC122062383 isoform X1 [Macadamia integrifolia]XP_042481933.1 uncharacterized protein LOC122062383 isoform X1 [Macadamia i
MEGEGRREKDSREKNWLTHPSTSHSHTERQRRGENWCCVSALLQFTILKFLLLEPFVVPVTSSGAAPVPAPALAPAPSPWEKDKGGETTQTHDIVHLLRAGCSSERIERIPFPCLFVGLRECSVGINKPYHRSSSSHNLRFLSESPVDQFIVNGSCRNLTLIPIHQWKGKLSAHRRPLTDKAAYSYGGVLVKDTDGTYMKEGGESIAIRMDGTMNFTQFLEKVCSSWNFNPDGVLLKWLVPGSRCAPISLKGDLDLQNMLDFNSRSAIVDVIVSRDDGSIGSDHYGPSRCSVTFAQSQHMDDGNVDETCDMVIACSSETPVDKVLTIFWEKAIEGVGQMFKSATDFRQSVAQFAIANGFRYLTKWSDKARVIVECAVEGCYWSIRASHVKPSGMFRIHKYQGVHQHPPGSQFIDKVKVPQSLIANTVVEKVRDTPKYPPTEIIIDMKRDYHLELSYMQCWRAKEVANDKVFGSFKESYLYIPWYCNKVIETNPGSHAKYEVDDDGKFTRLFVAYYAAV